MDTYSGEKGNETPSSDIDEKVFEQDIPNESLDDVADIQVESIEDFIEVEDIPEENLELGIEEADFSDELANIPEESIEDVIEEELQLEPLEDAIEVEAMPEKATVIPEDNTEIETEETGFYGELADIPVESIEITLAESEQLYEKAEASESAHQNPETESTYFGAEREVTNSRGTNEPLEVNDTPEKMPEIMHGRNNPPGTVIQPNDNQGDSSSDVSDDVANTDSDLPEPISINTDDSQIELTLTDSPSPPEIDYDNLEYRIKSPHEDFEDYWALKRAQEQAEVGKQAQTADKLPEAIAATIKARHLAQENESDLEAQTREWLHLKYGSTPYTTDAYPKENEIEESLENTDSNEEIVSNEDTESAEDINAPKDNKN